jgi:ABC-type transport system substrate-binding protein
MWIKTMLVVGPIVLLVFLLQSVFWVPRTSAVSDNAGRVNRLMLYMGANPEDMNTWTSTKTTDTTISDYLFEGLIKINHMFEQEPGLAETVLVKHEMVIAIPDGMTAESFKTELKAMFGESLGSFTVESEAGKAVRVDLETGNVLGEKDEAKETQLIYLLPQPGKVKLMLVPKAVKGQITQAIEPEFEAALEKRMGRSPWPYFNASALAALAATKVPEAKREKLNAAALEKMFGELLSKRDTTAVTHAPTIEFHIRHGIHWTDGPFFEPKERVWQCTCNGEPCGNVVADSKDAAIGKMKERGLVEKPEEAKYTAENYTETFGDEEKGYWWGKGPELAARDAKLTYDYLRNPDYKSPRMSSFTSINDARVFADDPFKFEVAYGELYSPALGDLAGALLPYHVWNKMAWKEEAIRRGKGPKDVGQAHDVYNPMKQLVSREREFCRCPSVHGFMVLEPLNGDSVPLWQNGSRCRLRRNEFYWDRKPEFQFIDYYVFDPNMGRETAEVVFNTGGLDIYTPRDFQVERYEEKTENFSVIKRLPNQYEYLAFNCSRPQLSDKRVRLALSLAIDVEQILKYVVFNQGVRINGPAYPVLPWYDQDFMIEHTWRTDGKDKDGKVISRKGKTEKIKFLPYDPDEAKAILKECGYEDVSGKLIGKDGKPLRLEFINSTGGGARKNTALLAKENWAKLGVDMVYTEYEWNVFIQQYVMALKYDICVLGWSGGIDHDSRQLWHTSCWPADGLNLAAYSNLEADKLMDGILKVYDYKKQVAMSHEIFRTIASDFPYVFLYSPLATSVMDKRIVWRKKVGVDKAGHDIYENRPINHTFIKDARQNLKYFIGELKRVEEAPDFKSEDYKR